MRLKIYEDKYIFTHNTPNEFEINNPNVSLTVTDENNIVYPSSNSCNNSSNKAKIVKINNHRYAAIKPPKNTFIQLD